MNIHDIMYLTNKIKGVFKMNKTSKWESLLNDLKRQVELTKQDNGQDEDTKIIDILTMMGARFPTNEEGIESLYQYIRENRHKHDINASVEEMELDVLFKSLKSICARDMSQHIVVNMPMFKIDNPNAFLEENHKNKMFAMVGIQNQIIYNIAKQMTTQDDKRFDETMFDSEIREFSSIYTYLDWLYEELSRMELICKLTTGVSEDDLENVLLKADGTVVLIWN